MARARYYQVRPVSLGRVYDSIIPPPPFWDRWQSERLMTFKIVNSQSSNEGNHECDIEEHIARQNGQHPGRGIIRACLETFTLAGPGANHRCLVYEPVREPLWIVQKRFVDQKLPLAKAYLLIILAGPDYLHSVCQVVHTGAHVILG
ncbi:hypothetical protein BDV26DRAFT_294364 [Aspergillus bertholletiae]|uniref:Uncharacterized protein n=1 Tax=Aspergillus bertholletiae TaxID=1226010 RepID=A0A5N7B240_9EURO|nr:hypothetical protein BDV26DRAFT_294364 [Aspergillus bertholletiae]